MSDEGYDYFKAACSAVGHQGTACPCCGHEEPGRKPGSHYSICHRCGWEDDPVQYDDPDCPMGPNHGITLTHARALWAANPGQQHWGHDLNARGCPECPPWEAEPPTPGREEP